MTFYDFFKAACGADCDPYPFQRRFAEEPELPHLLRAPTGAGKTATAVLGWLWRRLDSGLSTPRRLVYCLPMRVLVDQSFSECEKWLQALGLKNDVGLHRLMGGVDTENWYLDPERPAILIGTQDMLLSRALNRGYAATRFHWPIDFGLLNNDCLWVFDEPQLMGSGVSTSAQLAGLRQSLKTFGDCPSIWMSATLEPVWLDTVDFRGKFPAAPLELGKDKYGDDYDPRKPLFKRMTADKALHSLGTTSSKDMKEIAKSVAEKHDDGSQTLVVVNTVDRAKALYDALKKGKTGPKHLLLIHSRYRAAERLRLNELLRNKDGAVGRVIIATQVVEAGVDISARTLITELAPWASIVQRIGRCNRTGDDGPGQVFWANLDDKLSPPYELPDLTFAREQLGKLEGNSVSPRDLDEFKRRENIQLPFEHRHVIRKRDLLDLFDTAPDLSGNDVDIQRFVRGDDPDTDVQVFWRDLPDTGPIKDEPAPVRDELCNVPVKQAREFLELLVEKRRGSGYVWDHLDERWRQADADRLIPGMQILLPTTAGGYSDLGWDPTSTTPVKSLKPEPREQVLGEGAGSDPQSAQGVALTIAEHTDHVTDELAAILEAHPWLKDFHDSLERGARWHDLGKAMLTCQKAMYGSDNPDPAKHLAKSGRKGRLDYARYGRPFFRHELGSALAVLSAFPDWPFVVAYLIAAHHGRVRVSIRAMPDEKPPKEPETLFALGIVDRDEIPEAEVGGGFVASATSIDLSPMRLGGEASWTAKALKLLSDLGPFKLAYLESLLRAADVRASKKEASNA